MTEPAKDLDPNPLVERLLQTTTGGKLKWEPTASVDTFQANIGGRILRAHLESVEYYDNSVNDLRTQDSPALSLLNDKGKIIWTISSSEVKGGLWPLYRAAQRIAHRVDETVSEMIAALDRLREQSPLVDVLLKTQFSAGDQAKAFGPPEPPAGMGKKDEPKR